MARLGDVPKLFKSVGAIEFGRRVFKQVREDNLVTWAAALAYSWMFALFPFVLFLMALIPYFPVKYHTKAHDSVDEFMIRWLPKDAAQTLRENIEGNVNSLLHQPKGFVLYTGLTIALWAASGGMSATMSALDRCYELERGRPFHRQRAIALGLTIIVMLLLLAVACLLPIGSVLRDWVVQHGFINARHPVLVVFDVVRWILAIAFLFSTLAIVYYKGPSIKHHFHWLTPGAVFVVTVWVLLGFGFRFYMDRFGFRGYDRMYGALGGVAILLLLFYVDALVLLIGAEINSEIDFEVLKVRRGTRDLRRAEDMDSAT
jgi:membrane protein